MNNTNDVKNVVFGCVVSIVLALIMAVSFAVVLNIVYPSGKITAQEFSQNNFAGLLNRLQQENYDGLVFAGTRHGTAYTFIRGKLALVENTYFCVYSRSAQSVVDCIEYDNIAMLTFDKDFIKR